jgi:hypothetical protein
MLEGNRLPRAVKFANKELQDPLTRPELAIAGRGPTLGLRAHGLQPLVLDTGQSVRSLSQAKKTAPADGANATQVTTRRQQGVPRRG